MTIVTICTLVLNAVVAVLLVGYGLWLRNIFIQQLSAKDTTIETLNAAIKLHEGEVAALKGDRAPAIAAEYKTMREHADLMTREKQVLDEQMKILIEKQSKASAPDVDSALLENAQSRGMALAASIVFKHIGTQGYGPIDTKKLLPNIFHAIEEITEEINKRTPKGPSPN
jgi:hypothetical protein